MGFVWKQTGEDEAGFCVPLPALACAPDSGLGCFCMARTQADGRVPCPPKIALAGSPKKAKRKCQKMIHVAVFPLGEPPAVVWGRGAGGGAGHQTWDVQAGDLREECQGRRSHLPGSSAGRNKSVFTKARHIWQVTTGLGENRPVGLPDVWKWSEVHPKRCAWEDSDRS